MRLRAGDTLPLPPNQPNRPRCPNAQHPIHANTVTAEVDQ